MEARRIVQMSDWAPAQEAMFRDFTPSEAHGSSRQGTDSATSSQSRLRSMSVSLPWRARPRSSLFEAGGDGHLALEKCRSHGFAVVDHGGNGEPDAPSSRHEHHRSLKGMWRRASFSLRTGVMGLVYKKIPVSSGQGLVSDHDADHALDAQPSSSRNGASQEGQRPNTAHSTWHRLRQAASFNRQSRILHTGYGERPFGLDAPIESPTFPIPGSGEQPPIIPRSTGAAARQAAANACHGLQLHGYDYTESLPQPGWLDDDGPDDHESGIGIALTSSEMEAFVPGNEIDSDVDIGVTSGDDESDIAKLDFISELPLELAIQILAQLDAAMLATVSRVSRNWRRISKNQHIWRESFLREKTATYATGGRVQPGAGLGVPPIQPTNDWKEIYRVKKELDKRWEKGQARPIYLNGHTDSIYCLQFDENKIISGSRDRTIRVWDMKTYECRLVIGPPAVVNDCSLPLLFDENGEKVHYATLPGLDPSPAADGQPRSPVRAYHSTPALYCPPMHHSASILCLQYDEQILVTGSSDSTCIVYSIASGYRPIRRLRHHSAAVLDLVFDDKHIVTCSKDVTICVWDRRTGALIRQLRGHHGPVNAVQMRGNTIVSCSGDFRVKLWNIDTGKNIREFLGHSKGLACSQFTEDGRYIASAGNDKVIRIWDANTGECVREMKAHDGLVRSLHVDSISGRLVSGSYDSDIKVWDMETGQALLDYPKWHNSWVLSAKSDYRRIVSSGQNPKILILDFGATVEGIEMLEGRTPGKIRCEEDGGYI
ncbi:beta-TrCP [Echria macrotheca]|uniref:Beta-TrCP n=1 Tax=Echria macrotheca TaxID=438768 RepID=A0AAJ0BE32_9PEZI|nr:beta-TrCP [Echria macrotheca]